MSNAVYYHQGYAFIYISATKPTRHRSLWERLSIQQWLQEVIYPGVHFNRSTKIMASVSHHIQGFVWNAIIGPYSTVYPKKYAHGSCFAVLCCGYTLTDFPISIRLTSLALWQSNDCPSASKATLMYMAKYFMWIHYERLHNHNKAEHNKTVYIFLGIYCNFNGGLDRPCLS